MCYQFLFSCKYFIVGYMGNCEFVSGYDLTKIAQTEKV